MMFSRPLVNAKTEEGEAFYMVDDSFEEALINVTEEDRSYVENIDVCIRAYTTKQINN